MGSGYRVEGGERRRRLIAHRDALLASETPARNAHIRSELLELRERLASAEADPFDHVEEGLRQYAIALEAARAASSQQGDRWRRARRSVGIGLTFGALLVGARLLYQYHELDSRWLGCSDNHYRGQLSLEVAYDGMLGVDMRCVAHTAADCRFPCERQGACTPVDGACAALSDDDCRGTWQCVGNGNCVARRGHCVAGSEEDCRASKNCHLHGGCSLDLHLQECAVRSDGDCQDAAKCRERGECFHQDGRCVQRRKPATDDCRLMADCVARGFCEASDLPSTCPAPVNEAQLGAPTEVRSDPTERRQAASESG